MEASSSTYTWRSWWYYALRFAIHDWVRRRSWLAMYLETTWRCRDPDKGNLYFHDPAYFWATWLRRHLKFIWKASNNSRQADMILFYLMLTFDGHRSTKTEKSIVFMCSTIATKTLTDFAQQIASRGEWGRWRRQLQQPTTLDSFTFCVANRTTGKNRIAQCK